MRKHSFLMCLDGRPVDEIIRLLSTEYPEVECERIRQDVEVFLSEMVRKGFMLPDQS